MAENQSPPFRMIGATLAKVSTLLISVGWSPEAGDGGVWRPRPGGPATALDGRDQRGLLAAHEGAGAEADIHLERELRAQHRRPEIARPGRVADGFAKAADRERILGPAVDVADGGVDGERRDGHPFEHAVRIAFEDAPVHEGARGRLRQRCR